MLCKFRHAHEHRVEELVLIVLTRGIYFAGVHVCGDDGELAAVDGVVGFDPTARGFEVGFADSDAGCVWLLLGSDEHACAALVRCFCVQDMPVASFEVFLND